MTTAVPPPLTNDARWRSVVARDSNADGDFVYAVSTTGVFCRPSCPSRRAKPENVRFYDTVDQAKASGFRPCLRCNPMAQTTHQANTALIDVACRIIDAADELPTTDDLAKRIGLSKFHFHRLFKEITGMTPRSYGAQARAARLRQALSEDISTTSAIYDAGFSSGSRFYATSKQVLGMQPRQFKQGGDGVEIRFALGQTTLGAILVACTSHGICAIDLGDDADVLLRDFQDRFPKASLIGDDDTFSALIARVIAMIEAPGTGADLPLDIQGTAFQRRVWQALQDIPTGETASYAEIARRIGDPKAHRAVAGACGANTLAVAIPCHRVVRSDGSLSGYRWGVARKATLLAREAGDR